MTPSNEIPRFVPTHQPSSTPSFRSTYYQPPPPALTFPPRQRLTVPTAPSTTTLATTTTSTTTQSPTTTENPPTFWTKPSASGHRRPYYISPSTGYGGLYNTRHSTPAYTTVSSTSPTSTTNNRNSYIHLTYRKPLHAFNSHLVRFIPIISKGLRHLGSNVLMTLKSTSHPARILLMS